MKHQQIITQIVSMINSKPPRCERPLLNHSFVSHGHDTHLRLECDGKVLHFRSLITAIPYLLDALDNSTGNDLMGYLSGELSGRQPSRD